MRTAAIVLAGGRSSRMGAPKAALDWHGCTLLRRVTGIVARAVDGPVVVVRAPGQPLPALPADVEAVADAREGQGPLQGLHAGLLAMQGRADAAYVSSTDVPLLHPRYVDRVLDALASGDADVALPEVGGHRQPLAAAYRTDLLPTLQELVDQNRMRPAFLFERCRVRTLTEAILLADARLSRVDPSLRSVTNLNDPGDYRRARALPPPEILVERSGPLVPGEDAGGRVAVRAWTLGDAAAAVGLAADAPVVAVLNGDRVRWDPQLPVAAGDTVAFRYGDAGS